MNEIIGEYCKKAGLNFHPHTQLGTSPNRQDNSIPDSNPLQKVSSSLSVGVNLHRLDAEEEDLRAVKSICEAQSLFSSKKLMVIERAFSSGKDIAPLAAILAKVKDSNDTIMLLWEGELSALAKKEVAKVEKNFSKVQEFNALGKDDLIKWIRYEAHIRNVTLLPSEISRLALSGNDLWEIANELEKIAVGGRAPQGARGNEPKIFELGDSFFTSKKDALHALHRLLESGEEDFGLFSYLANYLRTLVVVKFYSEKNIPVPSSQKIHPFVVKKATALVRPISLSRLQARMRQFFEEDFKIKIGLSRPKDSLVRILFGGNEQKG